MTIDYAASLSDSELRRYVADYVVCGSYSWIRGAVNAIVKAKQFERKLQVTGISDDTYRRVIKVAQTLGVEYCEIEYDSQIQSKPSQWALSTETHDLRAVIPSMKNRHADMGALTAFYLTYHLAMLRKNEPDLPEPKIESSYILALWRIYFDYEHPVLSAKLLKDLLQVRNRPVFEAQMSSTGRTEEMDAVHSLSRSLSVPALNYLGFFHAKGGRPLFPPEIGEPVDPYNRRSLEFQSVGVGAPLRIRKMHWDICSVELAAQNAYYLHLNQFHPGGDKHRAMKCLLMRLEGRDEENIAKELGFESSGQGYQRWLYLNNIAIQPTIQHNRFDRWLEACSVLGIEPTLMETEVGTPQVTPSKPDGGMRQSLAPNATGTEPPNAPTGFRHSPDYRSLKLPSGDDVKLTERQAGVISELHANFKNGTPEVGQAYLIESVYGAVTENTLKRQFNNNELYKLLIETGERKGTVRLSRKLTG